MFKLKKILTSLFYYFYYNLIFWNNIKLNLCNIMNGKLSIVIKNNSHITIGKNLCYDGPLYLKSIIKGNIRIGNNCYFNHNCSITSLDEIVIGDNCMFGNNVVIVDHNHLKKNEVNMQSIFSSNRIEIGNNVWIGANVTILKGVHIGNNAIVAAGSVVNKNVGENEMCAGVPAKIIK